MQPTFDTIGEGPAIVFLHAGIADRRMWHPQWEHFAETNTLVRIDLCGFGNNPPRDHPFSNRADVIAILDQLQIASAVFVGASMGARVCVEIAIDSPTRVDALMLVGPGMPDQEWSQTTQDFWQVEAAAFDAGDIDGAVDAVLSFWVDGPSRATSNLTSPDRQLVATMQRQAFEHEIAHPKAADESALANIGDRLGEITAPAMVIYGDQDVADIAAIATRLASAIPRSEILCIADTAHLPSLEAPVEINGLLSAVLAALTA